MCGEGSLFPIIFGLRKSWGHGYGEGALNLLSEDHALAHGLMHVATHCSDVATTCSYMYIFRLYAGDRQKYIDSSPVELKPWNNAKLISTPIHNAHTQSNQSSS